MTLDRSEYIDRFYFRLPDIPAFLRRLKDELLAHPSNTDIPSSAEGCGCTSKITQRFVSELWKSMLPEDIPEGGRRILSRISMFLYTFVLNCYCTMPGYHDKIVINPRILGQVADITEYALSWNAAYSMTDDPEFDESSFKTVDEYVVYSILYSFVECYRDYMTVLQEAALFLFGINSNEYKGAVAYSNEIYLNCHKEISINPKDIIRRVELDQNWIIQ